MKRILFSTLAAIGLLTSCSSDDVINMTQEGQPSAIAFSTMVNKTGRGVTDATVNNIGTFYAWGFQSPSDDATAISTVFDNQEVENNEGTFTYSPLRYWTKGNYYWFCAYYAQGKTDVISFVPDAESWPTGRSTTENPLWGATIYWNNGSSDAPHNGQELSGASGDVDLIYAWWKPTDAITTGNEPTVDFAFKHLLSKVAFKFVNALPNNSIKITALSINSVEPLGTLDMTSDDPAWVRSGAVANVNYANDLSKATIDATKEKTTGANCLIPGAFNYGISFTVQQIDGTNVLATYNHTANVSNFSMEMGVSYVLSAEITTDNINPEGALVPIRFNPSVENWNSNASTPDVNIPEENND